MNVTIEVGEMLDAITDKLNSCDQRRFIDDAYEWVKENDSQINDTLEELSQAASKVEELESEIEDLKSDLEGLREQLAAVTE